MNKPSKKVVVALVFVKEQDKILFVRQNYGNNYWSLPGVVVEKGESVEDAARREVAEETGLHVSITRVVGIYSKPDDNSLAITAEGKIQGGTMKADNEMLECRFFSLDKLPTHVRSHFQQRMSDFIENRKDAFLRIQ